MNFDLKSAIEIVGCLVGAIAGYVSWKKNHSDISIKQFEILSAQLKELIPKLNENAQGARLHCEMLFLNCLKFPIEPELLTFILARRHPARHISKWRASSSLIEFDIDNQRPVPRHGESLSNFEKKRKLYDWLTFIAYFSFCLLISLGIWTNFVTSFFSLKTGVLLGAIATIFITCLKVSDSYTNSITLLNADQHFPLLPSSETAPEAPATCTSTQQVPSALSLSESR
jgi:hypothetical protein